MNISRFLAVVGVVVVGCGLASCRTPTSGIAVDSYPATKITYNSKLMSSRLTVTEVAATNRNGLLQAQVRVQNNTQQNLQFEYRYRWLDRAGMEVDTRSSAWTPVNVNAREAYMMQGLGPHAEAVDYILDIRFRQPNTRWE